MWTKEGNQPLYLSGRRMVRDLERLVVVPARDVIAERARAVEEEARRRAEGEEGRERGDMAEEWHASSRTHGGGCLGREGYPVFGEAGWRNFAGGRGSGYFEGRSASRSKRSGGPPDVIIPALPALPRGVNPLHLYNACQAIEEPVVLL